MLLATYLYAIGFMTGLVVPKSIDSGTVMPPAEALAIDVSLLALLVAQHSGMARLAFERWAQLAPPAIARSTDGLLASLALLVLFWQWRPVTAAVWRIADATTAEAVTILSLFGWLVVLGSFLVNHVDLLGRHQVAEEHDPRPMHLGLVIALWAAPVMTAGHLLLAAVATACLGLRPRRSLTIPTISQQIAMQARSHP